MAQPTLPGPEAQKQAAVAVFAQYEPPLYEAYLDMMLEWLAAVKVAMFAGGVVDLGLVPNPMTVFSQGPKWAALMAEYTADVAEQVLATPYKDLFADGTLFESRPFVRNWIAARENRLAAVPNEVFGLVSQIVDSATTNGASIPDVTAQVEALFAGTGQQNWKNRARTVARTEVVGAYNGGLYDAFAMIVANDPDTPWVKKWLATEDHRTRPDHVEADGQTVPWSQAFTVGGFQMMYPHDPEGPPQEVINCRCTLLLEIENEPTEIGNRQYKNGLTASFNPLEKRDGHGKWTKGGSLLKDVVGKPGTGGSPGPSTPGSPRWWPKPKDPAKAKQFDDADSGTKGIAWFDNADWKTDDQKEILNLYASSNYAAVNADNEKTKAKILDAAMPKKKRQEDIVVWRGIRNPQEKFGKSWNDNDVTGMQWTQKGYSSTSAESSEAREHVQGHTGGVVMRILIPKNVKLGGADMRHEGNKRSAAQEALLSRGLKYRVVADHGKQDNGMRYLDVEVVG